MLGFGAIDASFGVCWLVMSWGRLPPAPELDEKLEKMKEILYIY